MTKKRKRNDMENFNTLIKEPNFSIPVIQYLENIVNIGVCGKRFRVISYFIDHRTNKNIIVTTQREIAQDTGLSLPTVSKTINILKDKKVIKQINKGIYQIDMKKIYPEQFINQV